MDTYAALNDVLVNLFRDIMELEEQAIITQEYQDITNNDMHVIEAIGAAFCDSRNSDHSHEQPCEKGLCDPGKRKRGSASGLYFSVGKRAAGLPPS